MKKLHFAFSACCLLVFFVYTISAQELNPKDDEILMKISLTDSKKVPEGDGLIKFKEVGGKLEFSGTTDSLGKLNFIVPQGKKFDVTCQKYGITFKFGIADLPKVGSPATFDYDLQIRIDTIYKKQYTLDNVYFDIGKASVKSESFPALDNLFNALKDNPNMVIEIAGHTDNVGTAQNNLQLSFSRANSVRSYLVSKGIQPSRISAKGYGQSQPIASNDTEAGKAKNRRTEVRVIKE